MKSSGKKKDAKLSSKGDKSCSATDSKSLARYYTILNPNRSAVYIAILVWLTRLILGGVFIFSGFTKAVDPWGGMYKLSEYLTVWGIDASHEALLVLAVMLSGFEFVLGVLLILGAYRRTTSILATAFMTAMTVLTLYIWLKDPVADCGCFGEALIISNSLTFWKNVVLLFLAVVLLIFNSRVVWIVRPSLQWLAIVLTGFYILAVQLYGYVVQPMIDFRPYPIGTDLYALVNEEDGNDGLVFVYEKDGVSQEFTSDDLPDESWTFVERRENNDKIKQPVLSIFDIEDEDVTSEVISNEGRQYMLLVSDPARFAHARSVMLNDFYRYCEENDADMFEVIALPTDAVHQWIEETAAEYPVYTAEDTDIKMIARGTAALVALNDGIIEWKVNFFALPPDFPGENGEMLDDPNLRTNPLKLYTLIWIIAMACLMGASFFISRLVIERQRKKNKQLTNHTNLNPNTIMRKNIVAGNWKMNTTLPEGVKLAKEVNEALKETKAACDVVICVPFTHLASIDAVIDKNLLGLGAENCADHASGAYTGEVSAAMVASTGATHVIFGHSERRQYYGETGEILRAKVALALENKLIPIFCIGEVLEEREAGRQNDVVRTQLEEGLFNLSAEDFAKIVIAYEPVWAIGTGKTATAEQAEEIHAYIRGVIADKYGKEIAENTTILYGGSCKPSNAKELFAKPDVDGGLIGGASLKCEDFMGIVKAF